MNENDLVRLLHMRDSALEVAQFIAGRTREALDSDMMFFRALSMSVGIIGEAASKISPTLRDEHAEIPWRSIIAMRNFLIHDYASNDRSILWETATNKVPELLTELEKILPRDEGRIS